MIITSYGRRKCATIRPRDAKHSRSHFPQISICPEERMNKESAFFIFTIDSQSATELPRAMSSKLSNQISSCVDRLGHHPSLPA